MKSPREIAFSILSEELIFEHTFQHVKVASDHPNDPDEHQYYHRAHVGGKTVHVQFHSHSFDPHHHSAAFDVNNKDSHDKDSDSHNNRHILHHVSKVVHSFVKEKKPRVLSFIASDNDPSKRSQKVRAYQKFAEHVAKRHGGTAHHEEHVGSHVEFNR